LFEISWGDRFEELTGCRYHAIFPTFKLAMLRMSDPQMCARAKRVISIKGLLLNWLTGSWVEDFGNPSASGLANVNSGDWEVEVFAAVGLERSHLPSIVGPTQPVGVVTAAAASQFGLEAGTKVIAGLGGDFATTVGSGCEAPSKVAVTLGVSAVAHQTVMRYVGGDFVGMFCHRADENTFILGSASINGGSVIDWGLRVLGDANPADASEDPPIFIPLLHGERSPGRDPRNSGTWHNLRASHTAADLSRSILEGVMFDLAHSIENVQKASGETATDLVLSGSGFTSRMAASIVATVAERPTWVL
jgi:sugar (pentulose or hexulose) kinase